MKKKSSFLLVPKCPNKSSFRKNGNLLRYLEVAEVMGFFATLQSHSFRGFQMTAVMGHFHRKKDIPKRHEFPATLGSGLGRVGFLRGPRSRKLSTFIFASGRASGSMMVDII